ncbi:DUF2267 domain-containing protein [Aquabacter sp. P-9]|uniref:DUF2267 domain-containing protein n=1 Tax=Aquabacter sediminis TaxID=3029197 RepID=UPI00237E680A|nr:DUF2267 domain-containing protein [Aquabacter sp. P-9]MDE1571006.1 DUF2267 domain-containing protein [Aquabacter sp. P-9]
MPMPLEYQHTTEDFERFLADARETSGLTTRNQVYTLVQAVLLTFRRRLSLTDAIRFAGVLPPVLRAIFVVDWDPDAPIAPFGDRAAWTREAQSLRRHHNFAPQTCISDMARALRLHVDEAAFDAVLDCLPAGARDFWSVDQAGGSLASSSGSA